MSDETTGETAAPSDTEAPDADITAAIDATLAEARQEIASTEAAETAARQAEEQRVGSHLSAKKVCEQRCAPISAKLREITEAGASERERQALIELEERTHAEHAEALAASYRKFSGQSESESNPAQPGRPTQLDAHVQVGLDAD
jgi:hypothetical protein